MVHSLIDLCLRCVAQNLGQISQASRFLPPRDKELLIERMCRHRQFTASVLPSVTYHLFGPELKRVCLEANCQVTDSLLRQLASCNCQLLYLKISSCKTVTGITRLFVVSTHVASVFVSSKFQTFLRAMIWNCEDTWLLFCMFSLLLLMFLLHWEASRIFIWSARHPVI